MCRDENKIIYTTRYRAEKTSEHLSRRTKKKVVAYRCPTIKTHWHVKTV